MTKAAGVNASMEAKMLMEAKAQTTWESWVENIERSFRANHGCPEQQGSLKLLVGAPEGFQPFKRRPTIGEDSTEVGTDSSCDSENDHSDVICDNQFLPSIGSADHAMGTCHRCCFFPKGRCQNGYDCTFCHFEHDKRSRKKKEVVKQVIKQTAKYNVAPAEGAVKQPPASPPGFFGPLPPGLEDVVAKKEKKDVMAPVAQTAAPVVPATPPVLPPGSWVSPKVRKEPVTLTLDGGIEGLPEPPQPQRKPAARQCNNKLQPEQPVFEPETCVKQYSVQGLDPMLPVKKSVPAFLSAY
jgi:hypothetical protein